MQTSNDEILFLFLSLDMVPWNSASRGFAYIWQSKKGGIIATKTEETQIHFLSDVLVTVALLDLKVPTKYLQMQQPVLTCPTGNMSYPVLVHALLLFPNVWHAVS